ncbi:hypothetical protein [Paraflavitalea sp. CAU 1676]|uniref:hypothetical protein n=1 Tax=Paraflavitalea sp. CAU 1676 TaxID=3032598 RepID=UPI0023DB02FA|nr:hypothetical protein [Paraflavitalea sp. CAU 1676]MDF2193353.1 hypothetical protein [Paraflavitalea sp. CAU 1676]
MKLFTLAALLLLFSCRTAKVIPLKGNYEKTPVIYTSEKPVNEVWDNLIDLFAQRGLPIKFTDKNSGLIISDNMALTATWEDKNGTLVHPDANIVVRKIYNVAANAVLPETRSGTLKNRSNPMNAAPNGTYALKQTEVEPRSISTLYMFNMSGLNPQKEEVPTVCINTAQELYG